MLIILYISLIFRDNSVIKSLLIYVTSPEESEALKTHQSLQRCSVIEVKGELIRNKCFAPGYIESYKELVERPIAETDNSREMEETIQNYRTAVKTTFNIMKDANEYSDENEMIKGMVKYNNTRTNAVVIVVICCICSQDPLFKV